MSEIPQNKSTNKPPVPPLQAIMSSSILEVFIVSVIIVNVIMMAMEPPLPSIPTPKWLFAMDTVFNVIYVLETLLHLIAFGIPRYFSDTWHIVDFIVSISSLIELIFLIINSLAATYHFQNPTNAGGAVGFLKILRFFRILRPIKLVTFIPTLVVFVSAVFESSVDIALHAIFLMAFLCAISVGCWAIIGGSLEKRCVPMTNETYYLQDPYYIELGMDYYYSKYNLNYCGASSCSRGFECKEVVSPFEGVPASYSTPWKAFVSNLSFLTLRGWPNIFIALKESCGTGIAIGVIVCVGLFGSILLVNVFPAIFIYSLKSGAERQNKKEVAMKYPGDITHLAELELMDWAGKNSDDLELGRFNKKSNNFFVMIYDYLKPKQVIKKSDSLKTSSSNSTTEVIISEDDAPKDEITLCVPNCSIIPKLREVLFAETSYFSLFIIVIVVLNIISMCFVTTNNYGWEVKFQDISNIVFTSIFAFEIVVKILFMGPILYFSIGSNWIDVFLVVFGVLSIPRLLPRFVLNFRIVKLIRLARVYKMISLASSDNQRSNTTLYVTFSKVLELLNDLLMPLANVTILMLLLIYIFAIIGVQFFAFEKPFSYDTFFDTNTTKLISSLAFQSSSLDVSNLQDAWGGSVVSRMDFQSFSNSFATVMNLMVFNSWYEVMIRYLRGTNSPSTVWYFFIWIVTSNYFLIATITATVINLMENYAKFSLKQAAKDNKYLIIKIAAVRNRMILRAYFKTFKSNTIDSQEAQKSRGKKVGAAGTKRPPIDELTDHVDNTNYLQRFFEERLDYSLWLFHPEGYVRFLAYKIFNSYLFQTAISGAIAISVIQAMGIQFSSLTASENNLMNIIIFAIFMAEMLLQWVVNGLYGSNENAYLNCTSTLLDGGVNILMIMNQFVYPDPVFNALKVLRLVKIPRILPLILNNVSLKLLLTAFESAEKSMINVVSVFLLVIGFFGVICLQLWVGGMGHCNYPDYPSGVGKNDPTSTFPLGCNGNQTLPYLDGQKKFHLEWISPTDNYDDFFNTAKCIFRVFMFNNWGQIFYNTLDIVSNGVQPRPFNQPVNILFFLVLIGISIVVGVLFVSSIYYHFFISTIVSGRKESVGESQMEWSLLEESLYKVKPRVESYPPDKEKHPYRWHFYFILRSQWYQFLNFAYGSIPIILMMSFHSMTYSKQIFFVIDSIFSIVYLLEFTARFLVNKFKMFSSIQGKQELVVVGFITAEIILCISAYLADSHAIFFYVWMHVAACLRTYRVAVAYPTLATNLLVIADSFFGILPGILYLMFIVLLYGIIGSLTLNQVSLDFGNYFLNQNYGFHTMSSACLTLASMGTGNVYTEIINPLKENQSFGFKIYVELFFTSFYLAFTLVFRSFALLTINKYLSLTGQSLGLATQQINEFKRVWFQLEFKNRIKLPQLAIFIDSMNPPLGLKNVPGRTFVVTDRFLRCLLCCMPADTDRLDDSIPEKTRTLYQFEWLPRDLSQEYVDPQTGITLWKGKHESFTFFQVLVAVHRRFVLDFELPDEMEFQHRRVDSQIKLGLLKLRFSRYLATKNENDEKTSALFKPLNLLQRLNPVVYRFQFLRCLSSSFYTIQKRTKSLGFYNSDGFEISCLEKAALIELRASKLQYEVKRKLNSRGLSNPQTKEAVNIAQDYYFQLKSLYNRISILKEMNVEKLWRIETLDRIHSFQGTRVPVSAVVVDLKSNVFVGYHNGVWKYYKNMNPSPMLVAEKINYQLVQKFDFKQPIRSMVMTFEGTQMFLACGNEILILALASGKKKKSSWAVTGHLREHYQVVTCLVQHGKYLISGSMDGNVLLWTFGNQILLNTYSLGIPIYSLTIANVEDEKVAKDDIVLSHAVICGTSQGSLLALPLPLLKNPLPNSESGYWEGVLYSGFSNSPVSSLSNNYGLIYSGFADGSLKIFSVLHKSNSQAAPIYNFELKKIFDSIIHSGPIVSVLTTGGHMFSASHDFSILPWDPPSRPNAKTEHDFSQDHKQGKIFHSSPIIAMSKNSYLLATGDENGSVILSVPQDLRDSFQSNTKSLKLKCLFSFIEYNFNICFLNHNGCDPQEEAYLYIWNISQTTIKIRNISKFSRIFRCEKDISLNEAFGSQIVTETGANGKSKSYIVLNPNERATFRIIFSPKEEQTYRHEFEFLIDDYESYRVYVNGTGTKPKIKIHQGSDLIDFGTVEVGKSAIRVLRLENPSKKTIVVNLYENSELVPEDGSNFHFLNERNLSILPRCFSIRPNEILKILINFSPETEMSTFEIPFRFIYAGAVYTMGKIRARSEIPKIEESDSNSGNTSPVEHHIIARQNHILSMPRGLRRLHPTEMICPGELVNQMLDMSNWSILVGRHSTCFAQMQSGVFIELLNGSKNDDFLTPNVVEIQLYVDKPSYFEVWYLDQPLQFGLCDQTTKSIFILYDDLVDLMPKNQPQLMGFQNVELYVYSLGKRPRPKPKVKPNFAPTSRAEAIEFGELSSITRILLQLGFRLSRSNSRRQMEVIERINVFGIERVVTFYTPTPSKPKSSLSADRRDSIILSEVYGQTQTSSGDPLVGTAIYSPVKLYLRDLDSTYYHVTDKTLNKRNHDSLLNDESGTEILDLGRGLKIGTFDESKISRKISVVFNFQKANYQSNSKTLCHSHTTPGLIARGKSAKVDPLKLYPHFIKSQPHTVHVESLCINEDDLNQLSNSNPKKSRSELILELKTKGKLNTQQNENDFDLNSDQAAIQHFIEMMDQLVCGVQTRNHNIGSLYQESWFFVIDHNILKVISAEPNSLICGGINTPSCEVIFDQRGMKILDEAKYLTVVEGIKMTSLDPEDDKEQHYQKLQIPLAFNCYNSTGEAFVPIDSPIFLTEAWDVISKDLQVFNFKFALKNLSEERQNECRKLNFVAAMKLIEDREKIENQIKSQRKNGQLTALEIIESKTIQRKAMDILDSVSNTITARTIFDELIRLSNLSQKTDANPPKNKLSYHYFSNFLVHKTLKGFDKPLRKSEVNFMLMDLPKDDSDCISFPSFSKWFEKNLAQEKMEELDEKRVLSLLMDEYLNKSVYTVKDDDDTEFSETQTRLDDETLDKFAMIINPVAGLKNFARLLSTKLPTFPNKTEKIEGDVNEFQYSQIPEEEDEEEEEDEIPPPDEEEKFLE